MPPRGRSKMLLLVGVLLVWPMQVHGQTADLGASAPDARSGEPLRSVAPPTPARIDPTLALLARLRTRQLGPHSIFRSHAFDAHGVEVSVRFDGAIDAARVERLAQLGLRVAPREQSAADLSVRSAWMPWSALGALRSVSGLRRVESSWQPGMLSPLEVTAELIGARAARQRAALMPSGQGATIALLDTGIDVLHPAFFRADGGLYAWIDVNDNGLFDAGIDAVDLDADGRADSNETLRVLDATTVVDYEEGEFQNDDGQLQPAADWLYADMNRDRGRNVGAAQGFNESTPAYGEAIFVVDDADRDGRLEVNEKLVRLQTSKIRQYVTRDQTFVRGENLIDAAGADGASAAFHGSASAGILVGGQARWHQRVGVAPGAELLVYGLGGVLAEQNSMPLSYLEQALDDGAQVVLHEWTNAFTQPLDGSTNFEAAMQAAREAGVVQVTPVGNLNLARKHLQKTIEPGMPAQLAFEVPAGFDAGEEVQLYLSAFGSLQWRGGDALSIALESPGGERVEVSGEVFSAQLAGATVDITRETTGRGTMIVRFYLETGGSAQPLQEGTWTFEVSGATGADTIYGRITDAYSNWGRGIGWTEATVDETTLAFPATADAALGVAAYAARARANFDGSAPVGDLRRFSGRGPRIDGARAVDIAAPDDPFAPLGATPRILEAGWGRSWFTPFGGTSGASPHVAASVALLRSQHPGWSAPQLEARLVDAARADAWTPRADQLPDNAWGAGKLDLYGALFEEDEPDNRAPLARVSASVERQRVVLDAGASTDPDDDMLEYRFDFDYDGQWETDWQSSASAEYPTSALPQEYAGVARIEVRDEHGAAHGAVIALQHSSAGGDAAADAGVDASGQRDAGMHEPKETCHAAPGAGRIPVPWVVAAGLFTLAIGRRRRGGDEGRTK